jgi:hypothetical protein
MRQLPPPDVRRYQTFILDVDEEKEKCDVCKQEVSKGIHDLKRNYIYCFACADYCDIR